MRGLGAVVGARVIRAMTPTKDSVLQRCVVRGEAIRDDALLSDALVLQQRSQTLDRPRLAAALLHQHAQYPTLVIDPPAASPRIADTPPLICWTQMAETDWGSTSAPALGAVR